MKHLLALLCVTSLALLAVGVAIQPEALTATKKPAPVELGRGPIGSPTSPPALPASLVLAGEVIDAGADATGTITVHVGASMTSVSTGLPSWSATIAGVNAGDMVMVQLDTATYRYTSTLGSYGRLARLAGSDARVDIGELDRLRLSPLSTALEVLVRKVLGRVPATDSEHERAIRSVRSVDVDNVAGMLRRLAEQPAALPPGHASGYSVVDDEAAFGAYRRENAVGGYLLDAPAVPFRPSQLDGNTLLQGWIPPGDISIGAAGGARNGPIVLMQTATGFDVHTPDSRRNSRFLADAATPGVLGLVPANAVYEDFVVTKLVHPSQTTPTVVERRWIQDEHYRQLFAGDRHGLWLVVRSWYATYPQFPQAEPSFGGFSSWMLTASKLSRTGFFYPPGQPLGRAFAGDKVLPAPCKRRGAMGEWELAPCETAVHKFRVGGLGGVVKTDWKVNLAMEDFWMAQERPMSWRPGFDGLPVVTQDGQTTQFWRVDSLDGAGDSIVFVSRSIDNGEVLGLAGQSLMLDAGTPTTIDPSERIGDWKFATFEQNPSRAYGDANVLTTTFRFQASGEVHQMEEYADQPDASSTVRLGLTDFGMMRIARFRANVTQARPYRDFPSCMAAYEVGATQCTPVSARYFQPIRRAGRRVYGIEDFYVRLAPTYSSPPYDITRFSRVSYYEKLDPPPEAGVAGPRTPVSKHLATQRLR